jgi:hypothetical protein
MLAPNLFLLALTAPAVVQPPANVDPALTAEQRPAPIRSVSLTLDGRSVLVRISRGRCEGIAAATLTGEGPRVTLGTDPGFRGVCRSSLEPDSVRLPLG